MILKLSFSNSVIVFEPCFVYEITSQKFKSTSALKISIISSSVNTYAVDWRRLAKVSQFPHLLNGKKCIWAFFLCTRGRNWKTNAKYFHKKYLEQLVSFVHVYVVDIVQPSLTFSRIFESTEKLSSAYNLTLKILIDSSFEYFANTQKLSVFVDFLRYNFHKS